jgi:[ribosomal protein S5]-alanine N-acetyltransferase
VAVTRGRSFSVTSPILETSRLRLRPPVAGDLDRLTEIWTDPEVARLLVTQPRDRAEVAEKLAGLIELARGFGMWGVELRATGELIGRCGFYPWAPDGAAPEPELAYLLARPHWGAGLASEAARAALDALFRSQDPARVVALVRPEHAASRRVLEKLGMREAERHTVGGVAVLLYEMIIRGSR